MKKIFKYIIIILNISLIINLYLILGKEVKAEEIKHDIKNILLVGSDSRNDDRGRADSIFIATLDKDIKKIKLTSINRDVYVNSYSDLKNQKITNIYKIGGVNTLIDVINKNFGIEIDSYIIVNFNSFIDIIDTLGGIDIDVEEDEAKELNKFAREDKNEKVLSEGINHLNGYMTLSFCRIRNIDNGIQRNERQKKVLEKIFSKCKELEIYKYNEIYEILKNSIETSIEKIEILSLCNNLRKMSKNDIIKNEIPLNSISIGANKDGIWSIFTDIEQNKKIFKDYIEKDIKINYDSIEIEESLSKIQNFINEK